MADELQTVTIHTDGACIGNPGPGGYGVVLDYNGRRREKSGGYRYTTNNRMELMAVIVGLEALTRPCQVEFYSDSRYIVDAMTKGWVEKWQRNGWKLNKKQPAKNPDLWQRLLELCQTHTVEFNWVKGHSGNEGNEVCDRLATEAARLTNLPEDRGYPSAQFAPSTAASGTPPRSLRFG